VRRSKAVVAATMRGAQVDPPAALAPACWRCRRAGVVQGDDADCAATW
jgi:hypothetical protein